MGMKITVVGATGLVGRKMLQVLEEGKITDSLGRRVDFRNTIVIMTSNVGTGQADREVLSWFSPERKFPTDSYLPRTTPSTKFIRPFGVPGL